MNRIAFRYPSRVALPQVDSRSRLRFDELLRLTHDAYEAFMRQAGLPLDGLIREGTVHLPIVHAEAQLPGELRHSDHFTIELAIERIGQRAFTLGYRFLNAEGIEQARAQTVHVTVDPAGREPCPLPDKIRLALEEIVG